MTGKNILVLNCGSSSVKFQLIEITKEKVLAKGVVEKIGHPGALLIYKRGMTQDLKKIVNVLDHRGAISIILKFLTDKEYGVISNPDEIKFIGHRVVHGGEKFSDSVIIDRKVLDALTEYMELAPLHNPPNIQGIMACKTLLPNMSQVAVFDTAFHQTLPDYAYMYGLPYVLYSRYKIRRYGFHGTSHKYVATTLAKYLKRPVDSLNIITCHLGNGSSISAIKNGKSVDTSMGFTPAEGLIMGTRVGDLDPAVILYIISKEEITINEANTLINKHSGLLGISGLSNDMREIIEEMQKGDKRAKLAFDMFTYRIKKYIGSYIAVLNGADALIFTAGIGENSPEVREAVCKDMEFVGISLDLEKNKNAAGSICEISSPASRIKVFKVATNEELVIARDTYKILGSKLTD